MYGSYRSNATHEEYLERNSHSQSLKSGKYPNELMLDEIAPSSTHIVAYELVDEQIQDFPNDHYDNCDDQNGPNFRAHRLDNHMEQGSGVLHDTNG